MGRLETTCTNPDCKAPIEITDPSAEILRCPECGREHRRSGVMNSGAWTYTEFVDGAR